MYTALGPFLESWTEILNYLLAFQVKGTSLPPHNGALAFLNISIPSIAEAAFHNGLLIRMAILMEESQRRTCIRREVFPSDSLVVMGSRRNSWCVKWLSPLSEHCCVGNEPQPEAKAASSSTLSIRVRQPSSGISNQTSVFKRPENTSQPRSSRWQIFGVLEHCNNTQEIKDYYSKCVDLIYSWEYETPSAPPWSTIKVALSSV